MPTAAEVEEKDRAQKRYLESQYIYMHIFRFEEDPKLRFHVDDIAERTGVPASTIYNYISGVSCPPTEFTRRLYEIIPHPMLKRHLEPKGHELVPRSEGCTIPLKETVHAEFCEDFRKITELMNSCEEALAPESSCGPELTEKEIEVIRKKEELAIAAVRNSVRKVIEEGGKGKRVRVVR